MRILTAIPGADELVGKGVYDGMPTEVPPPVRDGHAVVVGGPAECAAAARQLGEAGWTVTVVTGESDCGCGRRRARRRKAGAQVVCATGIEYLEALVLRRMATGRIEAYNASALFVLGRNGSRTAAARTHRLAAGCSRNPSKPGESTRRRARPTDRIVGGATPFDGGPDRPPR